jgi:threonine dehydrogenase-like Zn-dependent dehydrogenase
MARQYLQDGGFLEPAISDPLAANTATTAVGLYNSMQYALIPAYDTRPGKRYKLIAAGIITTGGSGALTISPSISTSNAAGTTLGASIAQTTPVSSLSGPWWLVFDLVCTATGAPGGANSTIKGWGAFHSGGVAATANSGLTVTFGATAATYDHSVNQSIWISKTLSVAGSWTTQFVDFEAIN